MENKETTKKAMQKIGECLLLLSVKDPLLTYPLFKGSFQSVENYGTMGVTIEKNRPLIYFDPKFVLEEPENEIIFVLAHEAMHVLLSHLYYFNKLNNKYLFNITTDYVINNLLKAHLGYITSSGIFDIPELEFIEDLKQPYYENYSSLELYKKLEQNLKEKEQLQEQLLDNHDEWQKVDESEAEQVSASIIEEAKREIGIGKSPLLDRILFELQRLNANKNALKFLKKFLTQIHHQSKTQQNQIKSKKYKKPHKINILNDTPFIYKNYHKEFKKPEIYLLLDVSGSIVQEYNQKGSFVHNALSTIASTDFMLNIYFFDVDFVKLAEKTPSHKLFETLKNGMKGGGGTNPQPLIDHLKEVGENYPIIMITDGIMDEVNFYDFQTIVLYSHRAVPTNSNKVHQHMFEKGV